MTWWRTQRFALVALVVAAAAAIAVHVWFDVLPAAPKSTQVQDAEDGRAEVAGQTLRLDSARWDEFEAPAGSRTLSIRIDARAEGDAAGCGMFTLAETEGARVWANARSALDVPYDEGESGCQKESGSYAILAVFLLPDDADGPFVLDVPGTDEIARFPIEP